MTDDTTPSSGLTDQTAQQTHEFIDRSTSREEGLASNPGITDKATEQTHQFVDEAEAENAPPAGTTTTTTSSSSSSTGAGSGGGGERKESVGHKISEGAKGLLDKVAGKK